MIADLAFERVTKLGTRVLFSAQLQEPTISH